MGSMTLQDWMDILKVISTTATSSMQVDDDYSDLEEEYKDDCKEKFVKFIKDADSIINRVMKWAKNEIFINAELEEEKSDSENFDGYRGHSAYNYKYKLVTTDKYENRTYAIIIRGQMSKTEIPDEVYCLALEELQSERIQYGNGHFKDGFSDKKRTYRIEGERYVVKVKKAISENENLYFRVQIYSIGSRMERKTYTPENASEIEFGFLPSYGNKIKNLNARSELTQMYNEVIRVWGI